MADIEQKFGYLFEAEDLASPAVARAEAAVNASVAGLEDSLVEFSGAAEGIANAAGETVGEVADELVEFTPVVGDVFDRIQTGAGKVFEALKEFGSAAKTYAVNPINTVLDRLSVFGAGLDNLSRQIGGRGGFMGQVGGALTEGFGNLFGGGGLMGFILGPIGPVLKLLSPLINVVTRVLQPAFDAFGDIVENAFAPLSFMAETFVQSMAPQIQKVLGPIVGLLEQIMVLVGTEMQKAFGGVEGMIGPIGEMIQGLLPVAGKIISALVDAGRRILPLILKAAVKLVPIVLKLVNILAESFVERIEMFVKIAEEVFPDLVDTSIELLRVMLPLVEAVVKLGGALLKSVFAPLLIKALKGVLVILTKLMPYIETIVDVVTFVIDEVTKKLDDFFGPKFGKYMSDFKVLFIDPILEFFKGAGEGIVSGFKSFTDTLVGLVTTPMKILKKIINEQIIGTANKALLWDPPVIPGGTLSEILGVKPIVPLARGGIATGERGQLAEVGEAGTPEAIVPLTPQNIARFIEPALEGIKVPGIDQLLGLGQEVLRVLRGGLSVHVENMPEQEDGVMGAGPREDWRDLDMVVGIEGVGV